MLQSTPHMKSASKRKEPSSNCILGARSVSRPTCRDLTQALATQPIHPIFMLAVNRRFPDPAEGHGY